MRSLDCFPSIYLYRNPVDFRKSINGLGSIVESDKNLNLFDSSLFIFCCRRRRKIKILYWDATGFALWYKKLEADLFPWPKNAHEELIRINSKQLQWLLDGIDFWNLKPHQIKKYKKLN